MRKMLFLLLAAISFVAFAGDEPQVRKVAVFVQNRTKVAAMDDEIDSIRDRLTASLAEVEGISVVDSAQVADTFRRWKVQVAEEKAGMYDGIFTGGSIPAVAKMLGCDFVMAASVAGASSMRRVVSGRPTTVYTLRMTVKVMDSTGASVDGMPTWSQQLPILEAADEPMTYYNLLIDRWVKDAVGAIAKKQAKWRVRSDALALASFRVTTTVDKVINVLESQTKGVAGEQLQELRKVVGGATVELDGAVVGSAPGEFKAAPGLHQLRIRREWMREWSGTVTVSDGMALEVALELSDEGIAKWGTLEALRANVAQGYADAAMTRGIKVNVDSAKWRDVSFGTPPPVVVKEK